MQLLTESVSEKEVKDAINSHRRVNIDYVSPNKSEEENTSATGTRKIEVYAYGLTKSGNPVIRAFQNSGPTTTKIPEWKFFRLDGIQSWSMTDEYFDTPISDVYPSLGKYNKDGDKTMSVVYMTAKFDNKSKPISVNDIHGRMNNNDVFKTDTEKRMDRLRQQLDNQKNQNITQKQSPEEENTDVQTTVTSQNQTKTDDNVIDNTNNQNNPNEEPKNDVYKTDTEQQMEKLRQQMQNIQKIDLSKIPKR